MTTTPRRPHHDPRHPSKSKVSYQNFQTFVTKCSHFFISFYPHNFRNRGTSKTRYIGCLFIYCLLAGCWFTHFFSYPVRCEWRKTCCSPAKSSHHTEDLSFFSVHFVQHGQGAYPPENSDKITLPLDKPSLIPCKNIPHLFCFKTLPSPLPPLSLWSDQQIAARTVHGFLEIL